MGLRIDVEVRALSRGSSRALTHTSLGAACDDLCMVLNISISHSLRFSMLLFLLYTLGWRGEGDTIVVLLPGGESAAAMFDVLPWSNIVPTFEPFCDGAANPSIVDFLAMMTYNLEF